MSKELIYDAMTSTLSLLFKDDVIDDGVNDDDDDVDGDAALVTQFWPDLDLEKAGGRAAIIFKLSGQLQHLLSELEE